MSLSERAYRNFFPIWPFFAFFCRNRHYLKLCPFTYQKFFIAISDIPNLTISPYFTRTQNLVDWFDAPFYRQTLFDENNLKWKLDPSKSQKVGYITKIDTKYFFSEKILNQGLVLPTKIPWKIIWILVRFLVC